MILLDTHVWIWWIEDNNQLDSTLRRRIDSESDLAVASISCWEIAVKVAKGTIQLSMPIERWFDLAIDLAGVKLLQITPRIAVESARLPGEFHKDPADRIIVATSRVEKIPLATQDGRIVHYPHFEIVS